jgi:hypothetical protein
MRTFASMLLVLSLLWVSPAIAVLIRLKDRPEPVVGSLLRDEKDRVVLRVVDADGKSREETFKRAEIEEVVPPFSADRLAALDPTHPADYRDYAEELRARRRDPESRDVAIRLYLISAWLDREKLGRSSLLGMISLARSPEEEKKFRGALYLIDPRTTLDSLQGPSPAIAVAADDSAAQELLRALRLLRTGKGTTARVLIEKPAVAKLMENYARVLSKAEFNAAAGQASLGSRELRQVLTLELELESLLHPGAATAERSLSIAWSRELLSDGGKAVPSLSLESITEFDPRKCLWREGKWTDPK